MAKNSFKREALTVIGVYLFLSAFGILATWNDHSWPLFMKVAVWLLAPGLLFLIIGAIQKWQTYRMFYEKYHREHKGKEPE